MSVAKEKEVQNKPKAPKLSVVEGGKSDKKEPAKEATATEKKAHSKEKAVHVDTRAPKVKKRKWTLIKCQQIARQYPSEAVWASCHSSSYKSAVAHGWLAACLNQTAPTVTKKAA